MSEFYGLFLSRLVPSSQTMHPDSLQYKQSLAVLKESALFGLLADELLYDMRSRFSYEVWGKKRFNTTQEIAGRFHILLSGRLKVFANNPDTGRSITLFLLGPGDGFDVINLLRGQPAELLFEAVDSVELLSIPVEKAREWIFLHPEFNRTFFPYLGSLMGKLALLSADLALHDTETRLARLILQHANPEREDDSLHLIHNMSHASLAEMIGTVRTVINRQLQHWKEKGIIELDRRQLHVKDLHALSEKARDLIYSHRMH